MKVKGKLTTLLVVFFMLFNVFSSEAWAVDSGGCQMSPDGMHSWQVRESRPSCTEYGLVTYVCSACGLMMEEDLPPAGHSWSGWEYTSWPNCVNEGIQTRTCLVCGESQSQSVPATGQHSWSEWEYITWPSCVNEGSQAHTCLVCGVRETRPVAATGQHSWGEWIVAREATCVESGLQSHTCTVCGTREDQEIPPTGEHVWGAWTVTRAASCAAEGTETSTCQVCGNVQTRAIPMQAHSFGDWRTVTEASCTQPGLRSRTCTVCGNEEQEVLEMLPHRFGEWVISIAATDHSSGERHRVCSVCGLEEKQGYDPDGTLRRGDQGEAVQEMQQLLIDQGYLSEGGADGAFGPGTEAAVNQYQLDHGLEAGGIGWPQTINHLRHEFGEWKVIQEMTPFSAGLRERSCVKCGYTQSEEVYPEGTLRPGDKGDQVQRLQEGLNGAGHDCGTADGDFGGRTEAAVTEMQREHGMKEDGIAWPGLQALLFGEEPASPGQDEDVSSEEKPADPGQEESAEPGQEVKGAPKEESVSPNEPEGELPDAAGKGGGGNLVLLAEDIPAKPYQEGEEIAVSALLRNASDKELNLKEIKCSESDAYGDEGWMHAPLAAGSDNAFTYQIRVQSDEVSSGWGHRYLTAEAEDPSTGETITANVLLVFAVQKEEPSLFIAAQDSTGLVVNEGEARPLSIYVFNNGNTDLALDQFLASGCSGAVMTGDYHDIPAEYFTDFPAGASFVFTDYIVLGKDDVDYAEKNSGFFDRMFEISAIDKESGKTLWEKDHIVAAIGTGKSSAEEGPSVLLTAEDTAGLTGKIGETVSVQMTVTNNGSKDLVFPAEPVKTKDKYGKETNEGYVFPPEAYGVLLPGKSFTYEQLVQITKEDLKEKEAQRTVMVKAIEMETGEALSADATVSITALEGDFYDLTLIMTQTAPVGKSVGPADASGQLGSIEYSGSIMNTGNLTTDIYGVYLYLYPDTEASVVALDFGSAVTLEPSEAYPFSLSLAVEEGNISPSLPGVIDADFVTAGFVSGSKEWACFSKTVSFHYEVAEKEEEYSWKPPADALSPLTLTKEVSGKPDHTDGYRKNEAVHYVIRVGNPNDVPWYNIGVYDHINGSLLGVEIISGLNLGPHETREFPFTYYVAQEDVDRGYIENYARVWPGSEDAAYPDVLSDPVKVTVSAEEKPGTIISTKTVVHPPANKVFFTENEIILFRIYVKNVSDEDFTNVEIYDPLMDSSSKLVGTIPLLAAHHSTYVEFPYKVTGPNVSSKSVTNVATIWWNYANGDPGTCFSNPVTVPTGKEGTREGVSIWKEETSSPANGKFYREGEKISYAIHVKNISDTVINDIIVHDTLKVEGGDEVGSEMNLYPTSSRDYHFDYIVTKADVAAGKVINTAYADWRLADGISHLTYSNEVISPTGAYQPVTLLPPVVPPVKRTPSVVRLATPTPVPESKSYDSCRPILTGKGEGVREYKLEYCQRHGRTAKKANHILTVVSNRQYPNHREKDAAMLAACKNVIDLWTQDLNEEYDKWVAQAAQAEKPIITEERDLFFTWLTRYQELLEVTYADHPLWPAEKVAEAIRDRCLMLCYETHTAPGARCDSLVTGSFAELKAEPSLQDCLLTREERDEAVYIQEIVCGSHRSCDDSVDALLEKASSKENLAETWEKAKELYLAELDTLTNERYLAQDEEGRKSVAAERSAFGSWLARRETVLKLLYPGMPEIVNEGMAQEIWGHLLEQCGQ